MTRHFSPPPDSILVCCMRAIGDVILATPLIGLLKAAWPETSIDVLVKHGTGVFLEKDPRVRHVLYSKANGGNRGGSRYFLQIFRRYDLAINLNASDRGSIATLLAGRRGRVGLYLPSKRLQSFWKKLFFTHPLEHPGRMHVARLGQLVAEALGLPPVDRLECKVFWDTEAEREVVSVLAQNEVDRPFFVVHPFAGRRYKYWRFERFTEVSDIIAERYGLQPVWTSSPIKEEIKLLHEAASKCQIRPAVLPGILSLNQYACLLSKASFYLGLDTANSHMAAATETPMVVLFGPTPAEQWSPWNNNGPIAQQCPAPRGRQKSGSMILLQKDWPCVACYKAGCDDSGQKESPCLTEIEIDEVLDAADELLQGRRVERRS